MTSLPTVAPERLRITPERVLRALDRYSPETSGGGWEVTAEAALLAGCAAMMPANAGGGLEQAVREAVLVVGDDYAAGFRDGFDCSDATRRGSLRYVEGLEDGGDVRRCLRRACAPGTGTRP